MKFLDLRYTNEIFVDEFKKKLSDAIRKNQYILGGEVEKFEKKLSSYVGTKYSLGLSNGLDALTLSLKALDIKKPDEVLVPSNTFIATWIAVSRVGAIPVPVEFSLASYNIEPRYIEEKITKHTKAIIVVHLYGLPADMNVINKIAKRYNLKVVEDCAQAFGANYKGKKIGALSDVSAFSFFPTKNFGALGDAGGISTNSKKIYEKIKTLRNYGSSYKYVHNEIGFNARLDSIQASFLSEKINFIDKWNKERQKIAKKYLKKIKNKNILLPMYKYSDSVWHLFVVMVEDRIDFQKYMTKNDIETLVHYPIPPHKQKAYKNLKFSNLSKTENMAKKVISLPLYPGMPKRHIDKVIDIVNKYKG